MTPPIPAAEGGLYACVREWQEARKPTTLPEPGAGLVEAYRAAVTRMAAADEALAAYDLNGPAGGALVGQAAPTESTGALPRHRVCAICGCGPTHDDAYCRPVVSIQIGDVVLVGSRREPPRFQQVTTDYECQRWETRSEEITAVFRQVWPSEDASAAERHAAYLHAEAERRELHGALAELFSVVDVNDETQAAHERAECVLEAYAASACGAQPRVLVNDVVDLAGFGLRRVSTPEEADVCTGNDGVDAVYRPMWKRPI